jgi:hypothetical protein
MRPFSWFRLGRSNPISGLKNKVLYYTDAKFFGKMIGEIRNRLAMVGENGVMLDTGHIGQTP